MPLSVSADSSKRYLIIATSVSSLGGLLFGYDNIVISGAFFGPLRPALPVGLQLARYYRLSVRAQRVSMQLRIA